MLANPKYVSDVLCSIGFKEIEALAQGQSGQVELSLGIIGNIKIPLPPKDLQAKIVSEIEKIEKLEDELKNKIKEDKERILNLFSQVESKANKMLRLSDDGVFEVSIGQRVLKNEFVENGKIPVYSANVIEPFGRINKLLIKNFSKPSVLWGIDGDWMVNYIPKDYPFYPTDHCGVLRVKDNSVDEKYLAFILEKEGKESEFSRTKRASIDRVQGLKIPVPSLVEQQKIIAEVEILEQEIASAQQIIDNANDQKVAILKKYL